MTLSSLLRRMSGARPRTRVAAMAAVAVLAASGGGLAWASIPDESGVLHGCLATNGLVRIIDTATQSCRSGETPISWNQQGPTGPQGPAGQTGPAGPAGAPGAGSIVVTGGAAGPISQPSGHVIPLGGNNDAYPILTVPFTLTTAGFVHALAYGELSISTDASCDGNPLQGDFLYFAIDGTITGQPSLFASASGSGPSGNGSTGADTWLSAGTHTLEILYGTIGCRTSTSGTTAITNLHLEAIAY